MSIERELLERCLDEFQYHEVPRIDDLIREIQELLAQPEQTEQDSITDATPMAIMPNGSAVSNVYDAYEEGRKSVMSEQEPVAWHYIYDDGITVRERVTECMPLGKHYTVTPLYTSPPKREPLSDENVCEILLKKEWTGFVDLVRIIEKAHGIGGEE